MNIGPFRRFPVGGTKLFDPLALGNWVLYLDSRRGTSGYADNAVVQPWPDQSGNGYDAGNDSSGGNTGKMRMARSGAGLSPNGQPTVFLNGLDAPNAAVGINASPNPWPTVANGYTFYFGINSLAQVSSSLIALLWNEGTANFRWIPGNALGPVGYRDQAGTDRNANQNSDLGWQSSRLVIHAAGTVDGYLDGQQLTWAGGWNQQWNITPGALAGYVIGNLATNYVVGQHAYIGWALWRGKEDSLATQLLIDNFMRSQFGLAPI